MNNLAASSTILRHLRSLASLFILAALALALVSCGKKSGVRADGLYQADASFKKGNYQEKTFSYLRFYQDGAVVAASSSGTPDQVGKWLAKGHQGASEGTYTVNGEQITFTTGTGDGAVDYSGKIAGDQLMLDSLAHSNQNKASLTYKFVKQ